MLVVGQRVDRALIDAVAEQAAVVQGQRDLVACSQQRGAQRCRHNALVAHFRCQQGQVAVVGRGQRAPVNDAAAGRCVFGKYVVACHEVGIAHAQCRCHQAADIDLRTRAEQHTVRVQDEHLTVGAQAAQQLSGAGAQHPVQGNGLGIGLDEHNRLAGRG